MSTSAVRVDEEIDFVGYIRTDQKLGFPLVSRDKHAASPLLRIGESFEGHKVIGFRTEDETLILDYPSHATELTLRKAKVQRTEGVGKPLTVVKGAWLIKGYTVKGSTPDVEIAAMRSSKFTDELYKSFSDSERLTLGDEWTIPKTQERRSCSCRTVSNIIAEEAQKLSTLPFATPILRSPH